MFVFGVSCCMIACVYFPFCDARNNDVGVTLGEDFWRRIGFIFIEVWGEVQEHIAEPGKLLPWACICILLFWFICFTYKEQKVIYVLFATKAMVWKNPFFQNIRVLFWRLIWRCEMENSFSNYRMGKRFVYSKLIWKSLGGLWCAEMSVLKWRSGEWWFLIKCTLCLCTYVDQPIPCATTFTHIWARA